MKEACRLSAAAHPCRVGKSFAGGYRPTQQGQVPAPERTSCWAAWTALRPPASAAVERVSRDDSFLTTLRSSRRSCRALLESDDLQSRVEPSEILRVACDDR